MKILACALVSAGLVMGIGGTARADITPTLTAITPSGSNYMWTYSLTLGTVDLIDSRVPAIFTMYDVDGLVLDPASLSFTSSVTGLTGQVTTPAVGPPLTGAVVPDTAIPNVSIAFSGSAPVGASIGTVSFLDADSSSTSLNAYATQETSSITGHLVETTGSVPGPTPGNSQLDATPEPGSLALVGSGLLGMLAIGFRRSGSRKKEPRKSRRN